MESGSFLIHKQHGLNTFDVVNPEITFSLASNSLLRNSEAKKEVFKMVVFKNGSPLLENIQKGYPGVKSTEWTLKPATGWIFMQIFQAS